MAKAKKPLICIVIFLLIWVFAGVFYVQVMPGGGMPGETQPIFWMLVFLAGEIAACTYLILSAWKGSRPKDN